MGLSLATLITMGSITVGGVIIEKILNKFGEVEKANMVGIVSTTMLIGTVITCVAGAFSKVRTLGR